MDYTLHYVTGEGEQGQLEFYAGSNLEMYQFVKDFEQNHPNFEVLEISTDE